MMMMTRTMMTTSSIGMQETVIDLDQNHIEELYACLYENEAVNSCISCICGVILVQGIGIFRGDKPHKEPINIKTQNIMTRFTRDIIKNIACFGLVVFQVKDNIPSVVDLRSVHIRMFQSPSAATRYEIQSASSASWSERISPLFGQQAFRHDPRYHIVVDSDIDRFTGHTTGVLSLVFPYHVGQALLIDNALARDAMSADPRILLESGADKSIDSYIKAITSATAISLGAKPSAELRVEANMDAREDASERMLLHGIDIARNLGETSVRAQKLHRPYLMTSIKRAEVKPAPYKFEYVGAGMSVRQWSSPGGGVDTPKFMLTLERKIFNAFNVPYTVVENHTGNHANMVDVERDILAQTGRRYKPIADEVLDIVSSIMFDIEDATSIALKIAQQMQMQMHGHSHDSDATMEGNDDDDEKEEEAPSPPPKRPRTMKSIIESFTEDTLPLRFKIIAPIEQRKVALLYENGILDYEKGFVKYLMQTTGITRDMLVKEDPRILLQELAAGGGAKGPGHHGEPTLSKENEQQQTSDPTATLDRKRAKPTEAVAAAAAAAKPKS